jgi:hypothetical protein
VHPVSSYCTGTLNTRWWRAVLTFRGKKGREGQTKERYDKGSETRGKEKSINVYNALIVTKEGKIQRCSGA